MMEILIDAREQGEKYSLGTRKDRAQNHYNELGYQAYIERLDYGDYLFNNETVFEYKTITDLMSSIRDKTVFEEVANQTKHYPYSYLIIVGDITHYIQYMFDIPKIYNHWDGDYAAWRANCYKRYYGGLRRLRCYSNIIHCMSETQAFDEMLLQAIKCSHPKYYGGTKRPVKGTDIIIHMLCGSGNVSIKKAERIKETLQLGSPSDLLEATIEDFELVKGVGHKTATNLYRWLHNVED